MLKRIDPFEVLYLAVAIATFNHTTWAGAFLFEGTPPTDSLALAFWYLKGGLLATAIDLGMWATSRSLLTARGGSVTVLILAFMIAALGSFFTQLVYILAHTPEYIISEAVSPYWIERLQPFTDARVLLLPALLPMLAIVYTLARVWRRKDVEEQRRQVAEMVVVDSPSHLVRIVKEDPKLLETPERLSLPSGVQVNWNDNTFWDGARWRGPYKSTRMMMSIMRKLEEKRQGLEDEIE